MKTKHLALLVLAFPTALFGAITLDLTSPGSSGTINGALFYQSDIKSTGTGVINSFLRIQKNGTEEGYNTDGAKVYDVKDSHSVLWSSISQVEIDNILYREFLLDINQNKEPQNAPSLISLDNLKIYLASTGNLIGPVAGLVGQGATEIYDLDNGGDNWIVLNFNNAPGSGGGDMYAYIPDSLFNDSSKPYVYLYSKFGVNNSTNDGFEEWAFKTKTSPVVPVPGAILLAAMGTGLVGYMRRRTMI